MYYKQRNRSTAFFASSAPISVLMEQTVLPCNSHGEHDQSRRGKGKDDTITYRCCFGGTFFNVGLQMGGRKISKGKNALHGLAKASLDRREPIPKRNKPDAENPAQERKTTGNGGILHSTLLLSLHGSPRQTQNLPQRLLPLREKSATERKFSGNFRLRWPRAVGEWA